MNSYLIPMALHIDFFRDIINIDGVTSQTIMAINIKRIH